jgi:hypothetical protein
LSDEEKSGDDWKSFKSRGRDREDSGGDCNMFNVDHGNDREAPRSLGVCDRLEEIFESGNRALLWKSSLVDANPDPEEEDCDIKLVLLRPNSCEVGSESRLWLPPRPSVCP